MRNNTKKGFTLVELLVVIAILAILATVSVVGYTAFIEGAAVQVDEDMATQLNHFLEAYKVNHRGDINEDNIREVTEEILELAGIEELNPQAAQHGYHFYFDLQKGEFVSLHDNKALGLGEGVVGGLTKALAAGEGEEEPAFANRVGNSFTDGRRYFLVDTKGEYADVINAVYDFNGDLDALETLYYETVSAFYSTEGTSLSESVQNAMKDIVYLTNSGTLVVSVNHTHTVPISNITETEERMEIAGIKVGLDGSETISKDVPLAVVSGNITIEIPGNVMIYGDSLYIETVGEGTVTLVIDADDWSEVEMDAGFTTPNVVIEVNGTEYTLQANKIVEKATGEALDRVLTYSNPMEKLDIQIQDFSDKKVHTVINNGLNDNVGYMAWNKGELTLQLSNKEVEGINPEKPVSSTEVIWTVEGDAANYIDVVDNKLVLKDVVGNGNGVDKADYLAFAEAVATFTVKATSVVNAAGERVEDGKGCPYATATINVVKLANVKLSMEGSKTPWTTGVSSVVLSYDGTNVREYNVTVFSYEYNFDEARTNGWIELDNEITLETVCNDPACCVHNLKPITDPVHSDCSQCYYTLPDHAHDANCCGHEDTYVETVNNTTYKVMVERYVCNRCTKAGQAGHWCYEVFAEDCVYLGKTLTKGSFVRRQTACKNACQYAKGSDVGRDLHEHTTHDDICASLCNHVCGADPNKECRRDCGHVHTTQTDCIECQGHTPQTIVGKKITTTCGAKFVLNVTVDNLVVENAAYVTVLDFATISFSVNPAFASVNGIELGNKDVIYVSDLFKEKDGKEYVAANENGILKFYTGKDANGELILVPNTAEVADNVFSVNSNSITLSDGFEGDSFTFKNTANNVKMAVFLPDGTQISEEITFNVVDAYNVRTWDEFTAKLDTTALLKDGNKYNPIVDNIVLLNDITMAGSKAYHFAIGTYVAEDKPWIPHTLYGNCFTINIENGRESQAGIINLYNGSELKDAKIIGRVYTTFAGTVTLKEGSSCVSATGDVTIDNCYIANTRSPLRVNGGTVVVKNSVFFGGRYSNIDMVGGILKIQGTVTTIQQTVTSKGTDVIGAGIAGWFNDNTKTIILEDTYEGENIVKANLVQYNFLSKTLAEEEKLPTVSYANDDVLNLNTPFAEIFTDTKYGSFVFDGSNGEKFVNAAIVATDRYMIKYSVAASDGTVTLTVMPGTATSNVDFIIEYDRDKYTEVVDDGNKTDGIMHVTGATWLRTVNADKSITYTTYTFTVNANQTFDPYDFKVDNIKVNGNEGFKTIVVDGLGYSSIPYTYENKLPVTGDIFHNNGIHCNRINAEIHSTVNTDESYRVRLEEYIEMTDGDGIDDNYYAPDNFDFGSSGSLVNYWEK